jgi:hypothetical protein
MTKLPALDRHLVVTDPGAAALTSQKGNRPWRIDRVYLSVTVTLWVAADSPRRCGSRAT